MNIQSKAAFYKGNKSFEIRHVELIPPQDDEVQIEVAYCGVCGTDLHAFHGNMDARIGNDRIIGHEMSGVIAAKGKNVSSVNIGDHVVVLPLVHCGTCPACEAGHTHICHNLQFLGLDSHGAFQQHWNVPEHTVHVLPKDLSLAHAALIEPVSVACHGVNRANLNGQEDVLVIGGGPIGMLTAIVAKSRGCNVVISEVSQTRLDMAKKLGFSAVNPIQENLVEHIMQLTNNKGADVVFEVSGTQAGVDVMTEVAACRGRIVMTAIHAQKPQIDLFKFFWRELELMGARVYMKEDYENAIKIVASGDIDFKTIITDIGNLDEMQHCFEMLENNPTAMKTLIKCSSN